MHHDSNAAASEAALDPYGIRRWGGEHIAVLPNGHIGLKDPSDTEAKPVDLIAAGEYRQVVGALLALAEGVTA